MNEIKLRQLLKAVQSGTTAVDDALQSLRDLPYEALDDFAKLDHHRELRQGFPEVVYCPGKAPAHLLAIVEKLSVRSDKVLATRADPETASALLQRFPNSVYHEAARIVVISQKEGATNTNPLLTSPLHKGEELETMRGAEATLLRKGEELKFTGDIEAIPLREGEEQSSPFALVLAAGTADYPVAEEAAVTAIEMGCRVERLYDVGVAGLHRLLAHRETIQKAYVLIVVAGMEGALASVVGGLVSRPVIAVPTSVGYGASFGGLAPLLTMLNSCAAGVSVVNIDNGFGAGYLAAIITRQ